MLSPNLNASPIILAKFNSLPNDKILDWSILKGFADNKDGQKVYFFFDRVENIVGIGENALSFPHNVLEGSCSRSLNPELFGMG